MFTTSQRRSPDCGWTSALCYFRVAGWAESSQLHPGALRHHHCGMALLCTLDTMLDGCSSAVATAQPPCAAIQHETELEPQYRLNPSALHTSNGGVEANHRHNLLVLKQLKKG